MTGRSDHSNLMRERSDHGDRMTGNHGGERSDHSDLMRGRSDRGDSVRESSDHGGGRRDHSDWMMSERNGQGDQIRIDDVGRSDDYSELTRNDHDHGD